jgi:hypothetical protein
MTSAAADFAQRMRDAADTIRVANLLYDYQPEYGFWNPRDLLKEADVVENVDDAEIEKEVSRGARKQ